jgi:hypothetical protein
MMVARKPVRSSTVTQLLMMENQWIWERDSGQRGWEHKYNTRGRMA